MMEREEKKNKRAGMLTSVGVHMALLIIFFFILAWRAPNPPLPEYGLELDIGFSEVGSGEEAQPDPTTVEDNSTEETQEEVEEVTEPVETEATEEVEPVETEAVEQVVTQDLPSPDVIEPQEQEQIQEVVEEKEPEEVKPQEEVRDPNPQSLYQKPADSGSGSSGEGDDTDKVGDKGDPEGLDDRATYTGTAGGGGGGPQLQITGWNWDSKPNKKDQSDQSGRIKFWFEIDEDGNVTRTKVLETTVTPDVVQFYKQQLTNTTFSQTNNVPPPPRTEGVVTFVIKSN